MCENYGIWTKKHVIHVIFTNFYHVNEISLMTVG